jgi:hypothetical protein
MTQKFTTDHIKSVGKDHYGEERRQIRTAACAAILPENPRILELYGSGGNMTTFYKSQFACPVIVGVDKAPGTDYCMDNEKFVEAILPKLPLFDLYDFDAYGSPNPLIWKALASIALPDNLINTPYKFIIVSTDGLGLPMKQNPKINWMKYFLYLEDKQVPDLRRPWDHHIKMTEDFFQTLAHIYDYKVTCLSAIQGKGKNFVFAAYQFEKI